jgi:hypothetical protein
VMLVRDFQQPCRGGFLRTELDIDNILTHFVGVRADSNLQEVLEIIESTMMMMILQSLLEPGLNHQTIGTYRDLLGGQFKNNSYNTNVAVWPLLMLTPPRGAQTTKTDIEIPMGSSPVLQSSEI